MLIIKNFSKNYNGVPVLSIDKLHFKPGVYWIKGENGSGKTTLFKSLAGILPFEGEIRFDDGVDLKKNPVNFRKRISYSEAEPQFPGFLTSKDLIRFVGKIRNVSSQEQQEATERFAVNSYFNNPCETHSSGMLKKVSLSLAFLGKPMVIILDEPFVTLDEDAREMLFKAISEYIKAHKTIFLISSHQSLENQYIDIANSYLISNGSIAKL